MMQLATEVKRGRKPSSLRYYQDGPPSKVDLARWTLDISGIGVSGSSFTYEQLNALPRIKESRRYVCVCNWSVRENWSGFLLADFLELAGWNPSDQELYLKQVSIGTKEKGVYESTVPLGDALRRRAMIIDKIDDEPLSVERGYPIRFFDFGLYGYKSVKGLKSLEITPVFELGEWERRAGYALDGKIQPKRYRLCYLNRHVFIDTPGEVTDI